MSRCEHGQIISIYCLNQTCTWRQAGGCESCFKRYHPHPVNISTITHEKLDELYRKMIVRPDPKVKSRVMQEAVYNYLMIMKSQFVASMENISRAVTERLGYPYMCREGQLGVFNRFKNKQYKKIQKKQLKSFVQFATQKTKQQLEQNQRNCYISQIQLITEFIQKLNQTFQTYQQITQNFDPSFKVENAFLQKITQIGKSIEQIMRENSHNLRSVEHSRSREKKGGVGGVGGLGGNLLDPSNLKDHNASGKDRKVSIDLSAESGIKGRLNSNQNQINQRRKRLLEMDNSSKGTSGMDEIKVDLAKQNTRRTSPGSPIQINIKKDQVIQRSSQKQYIRDLSTDRSGFRSARQGTMKEKQIDPRLQIVQNTLPREASRPKFYQYSHNVKEKKITIPMKMPEQKTENSSPILKKKKTIIQGKALQLTKIESMHNQQKQSQKQQKSPSPPHPPKIQQQPQSVTQASQQQQSSTEPSEANLLLRQNETDSLALLISSLSLSAEEAIPILEASIKYAHNNLSAAEYLSYIYLEIGKPKECLSVCNQFLEQVENSAESKELAQHLSNNKAAALNMLGRYSQSINILQKCIQYTEKDIYYKNLADAYFSIGIFQKAVINYQKAIKLNPQHDQALFNLAVCLYMQGHFIEAQLNVQKALKIDLENQGYLELSREIKTKLGI